MSEITVTLPKSEYDGMQRRLNELNKNLQLFEDVVSKNQYFSKIIDGFIQEIYYRPLNNDQAIATLETKFIEAEQKYVNEIRTLKTLIEQKNSVIFELNDRIKEYENLNKEKPVENHPTVSPTHTTTSYHLSKPKPKKKPWWKISWWKLF